MQKQKKMTSKNILKFLTAIIVCSCSCEKDEHEIIEFRLLRGVFTYNFQTSTSDFKSIDVFQIVHDTLFYKRLSDTNCLGYNVNGSGNQLKILVSYTFPYKEFEEYFNNFDETKRRSSYYYRKTGINDMPGYYTPDCNWNYFPYPPTKIDSTKYLYVMNNGIYYCMYVKYRNGREVLVKYDTNSICSIKPNDTPIVFPQKYILVHRQIYTILKYSFPKKTNRNFCDSITRKIENRIVNSMFWDMSTP